MVIANQAWVLEGFGGRFPGVVRDPVYGLPVYRGESLPGPLQRFRPAPHSWPARVQDLLNGVPPPSGTRSQVELRPRQREQAERIAKAYQRGAPGYLLGLPTGSGKTGAAITGIGALSPRDVLVVTKLDILGHWRTQLDVFGTQGHRWILINPERLWRLFRCERYDDLTDLPPEQAREVAAHEGVPHMQFGAIIVDESQIIAHSDTKRFRLVDRLVHTRVDEPPPYRIWMSATAATHPGELVPLADLIAYAAGVDRPLSLARPEFTLWLRDLGFMLNRSNDGRWYHDDNATDVELVYRYLYQSGLAATATLTEVGLPEQQRTAHAIELSPNDYREYELGWREFRRRRRLSSQVFEPVSGLSKALRDIQKASLIKVPYAADLIVDLVADGYQVAVPTWYVESVNALASAVSRRLAQRGLPHGVAAITGAEQDPAMREKLRRAFQTGQALVVVFNVVEGINLHAGEQLDGARATTTPRKTVIFDVFTGGKRCLQAEGRTQRDGQRAEAIYLYAAGTTEQKALVTAFRQLANTSALNHNDYNVDSFTSMAQRLADDLTDRQEAATSKREGSS